MRLDLVHLAVEKVTLALEGIGAGKVRVNSSSLDHPVVVLAGEALEIVGIEKKVMIGRVERSAYWLDQDPTGGSCLVAEPALDRMIPTALAGRAGQI
jgi:hypothetical protein